MISSYRVSPGLVRAVSRSICLALAGWPLRAATPLVEASAGAPATYLKSFSLEELLALDVTSVSRRPEQLATAASAVSVLTGDDIRRSGATTLADALRFSTGLQVARIDGRTWGVASRGFNGNAANKLLVMLDGRSLYTPLFSGVFWDVQDTEFADIDRIEVVRGPGATMWGSNAVNGVISIQTKPAHETRGTLVTVGGGDEERQFASLRHGLQLAPGIDARVYFKEYHRDDLKLPSGADANDDARMRQGGFRVDGEKPGGANAWTLQGDMYHGFLGATGSPDTRVAGGNVLARAEHRFSPDRSLHMQAYYDRVERFAPGQFREWRDTFDADLQFDTLVGARQQIVAGVAARRSLDRTSARGTVRFSPANRAIAVFSGFVQDEIRLADDRLEVTLGAKLEDNDSTGTEFQPSFRAAFHPTDRQTVWASVARAVRTPARFDDDLRFVLPAGGAFIRGDSGFRSETLNAYELGYRAHLWRGWALDVSLFANDYDDLRSQERSTEPDVLFVLGNQLNARTRGGEISIAVELTKSWRVRALYARLHERFSLDPGSTDITGGALEGNDPQSHWTLVSSWDLPHRWGLDLLFRHVGALPSPHVPAYSELDARLGWQPAPAWELSLVGQNLLHEQHTEFGSGPAARQLERSVHAKATWRF